MQKIFKIIAALIGIPLLAVIIALNVILSLIDKDQYRQQLEEKAKMVTGRELKVMGGVNVGIFPNPYLQFSGLELASAKEDGLAAPEVRIDAVRLGIQWSEAFSSSPHISFVTFYNPMIDVQRAADGTIAWSGMLSGINEALKAPTETPGAASAPFRINAEGGKILISTPERTVTERIENLGLNIVGTGRRTVESSGSFTLHSMPTKFTLNFGFDKGAAVLLDISQDNGNKVKYEATRSNDDDNALSIDGQVDAVIPDIGVFLLSEKKDPSPAPANAGEQASSGTASDNASMFSQFVFSKTQNVNTEKMPFTIKGKLMLMPEHAQMESADIMLGDSKGNASIKANWEDKVPQFDIKAKLDSFNTAPWSRFSSLLLTETKHAMGKSGFNQADIDNPFPKKSIILLDLAIDTLNYSERQYKNITVNTELSDGIMTLNELKAQLPGNATLSMFGIVTKQIQGMRFEGSTEIRGEQLRDTLTFFDSAAESLPKQSFGEFYAKANIFISQELMRLSEANLKIGDLDLNGGMVTYFEATPRVEAEIHFKGTNLDYFRDIWRTAQEESGPSEFQFFNVKTTDYGWLKRLGYIIDFKVSFENFTFLERLGQTASLRLYAKKNELNLMSVRMYYPDGSLDASFKLDVSSDRPRVDLVLNMPYFNTNYLDSQSAKKREPLVDLSATPKKWSEELFDFSWMIALTGNFDISINSLIYDGIDFPNFRMKARLQDQEFKIQNFTFDKFGGKVEATGSLVGGKVPGVTLNFMLYNIDLKELLKNIPGTDMLDGRMSFSGYLSTAGIHFLSWVSQAEVKLVMSGRGIKVEGLNIDGILSAVQAARSTSDVVSSINKLIYNGRTDFAIDGNINMQNGVMRTPGIRLKSGPTNAYLEGEMDVLTMRVNLATKFNFPQLSSETIPNLPVNIQGSVDNFAVSIDTSSLEAWVAKRIVSQ